jgi:hypothetical protein
MNIKTLLKETLNRNLEVLSLKVKAQLDFSSSYKGYAQFLEVKLKSIEKHHKFVV